MSPRVLFCQTRGDVKEGVEDLHEIVNWKLAHCVSGTCARVASLVSQVRASERARQMLLLPENTHLF